LKIKHLIWLVLGALLVLVLLGPRPSVEYTLRSPDLPPWTDGSRADLEALERHLADAEARVEDLVPGAGKRILWADPEAPNRTRHAVVYLHGFSATRQETAPLSREVARALGANLFETRLTGHGRSGQAMAEGSVDAWLNDGLEALEVGRRIGDRVVIIGTSTGGTLATWLASGPDFGEAGQALDQQARVWGGPPSLEGSLEALVLISPNFGPADRSSRVLLWPWGGWLAERIVGPERCFEPVNELQEEFWTECYPTRALLPMMGLVDLVDGLDPSRVTPPTLVIYSSHDQVVDPELTLGTFERWGSSRKELLSVETSGDPSNHVVVGEILSSENTGPLARAITRFVQGAEPGG
jgi:esterase/lipase